MTDPLVVPALGLLGPIYAEQVSDFLQGVGGVDATDAQFAGGVAADGTTDDTSAMAALDEYIRPRGLVGVLPEGTAVSGHKFHALTDGAVPGLKLLGAHGSAGTKIDNRLANDFMIDLDIATLYAFAQNPIIGGFTMLTTTSPANSGGIRYRGQTNMKLFDLVIDGISGDGICQINNGSVVDGQPTGDPDSSSGQDWLDVLVKNVGGIGFNCPDPTVANGSGLWTPRNVTFIKCRSGGARYIGEGVVGTNFGCSWNGEFGLQMPETGTPRVVMLQGGVFDGNEFYNFDIRSCILYLIEQVDSITRDGNAEFGFDWITAGAQPSTMFNIGAGAGGAVSCGVIRQPRIRNTTTTKVNVFYYGARAARQYFEFPFYESDSTYLNKVTDLMAPGNLTYEDTDPDAGSGWYLRTLASRAIHRGAPFGIPHGSAPSDSVGGDMWSTTSGLFFNRNNFVRQVALIEEFLAATNHWTGAQIFDSHPTFNTYLDILEQTDPAAPLDSVARLFVRRTGGGKSQLVMKTESSEIIIATEA